MVDGRVGKATDGEGESEGEGEGVIVGIGIIEGGGGISLWIICTGGLVVDG